MYNDRWWSIITLTFCCDNLWKSKFIALEKPGILREFFFCYFVATTSLQCFDAVFLGGRKGIWPVKKLSGGVLVWLSVWSAVQTCIWSSWCHCHSLSVVPVKSRLVLPFWYRLTRVVPDKGPLSGCVFVATLFMVFSATLWPPCLWDLSFFYSRWCARMENAHL